MDSSRVQIVRSGWRIASPRRQGTLHFFTSAVDNGAIGAILHATEMHGLHVMICVLLDRLLFGVLQQGEVIMQHVTRRQFLQVAGASAAALTLSGRAQAADAEKKPGFTLPKLPYAFDALEPHI